MRFLFAFLIFFLSVAFLGAYSGSVAACAESAVVEVFSKEHPLSVGTTTPKTLLIERNVSGSYSASAPSALFIANKTSWSLFGNFIAARAGAAGTRILVNSAGEAQLVVNGLRVSEHAALRMTERGVSLGALEKTLGQTPFKYFHNGAWKTGFYDPSSRIFAGSINGELTTIINGATPRYIENLMRTVP